MNEATIPTKKILTKKITDRVDEVFGVGNSWNSAEIGPLPLGDPHIQDFLTLSNDQKILQGRIGYCFEPLIRHVAESLKGSLSFIVLMYSNQPEQRRSNVPMGKLNFCALNNQDRNPEAQLRFRKIFRFVGSNNFSRTSVQTSKILFERPGQTEGRLAHYIYSFEEDDQINSHAPNLNIIPVSPLSRGILSSLYFRSLFGYMKRAVPENINEELGRQFERFYLDGDLEKDVIAGPESEANLSSTIEPYTFVEHINRSSLAAFENLLITFGLQRSADLRRRFLNYFAWMLLCDSEIKSYSYLAAMRGSLPQGEFIIASRKGISIELATLAEAVSNEAFAYLFSKQGDEQEQQEIQEYSSNKDNQHATLEVERAAIYKYIDTKGREQHGSEIPLRKSKAILGLDDAILNYVGPIVTDTFKSPHQHLSLEPFWSEGKTKQPGDFQTYIADLTLNALRNEYESLTPDTPGDEYTFTHQQQKSRVNPFLIAMYPVAGYLAHEMRSLRDYERLTAIAKLPPSFLAPENRKLGDLPLDESGLLSMNIVFWDIATRQFRYCSVSFINNDPVFDHTFSIFFRLIDTLDTEELEGKTSGRGILDNVLLMSDVLFRESTGKIEPTCIVFHETKLPEEQESIPSSKFPRASVAEYIEYLDGEGRKAFDKLYLDILLGENKLDSQKKFEGFCADAKAEFGVWAFLNKPTSSELVKRTISFLKRYGLKTIEPKRTVAQFLGYITWLWLCYRDRLTYYYYIPAQLPFNERIGGFAIATEIPVPDDILNFLFVSVAPRIVAHPALLHHREAVTKLSRTIQQCWFDALLHLIYNSYGLKDLEQNLNSILRTLDHLKSSIDSTFGQAVGEIEIKLKDSKDQMNQISILEDGLKKMFDKQLSPDKKLVDPIWLFNFCLRLSGIYAQNRNVTLILSQDLSPESESLKNIQLHSPVLLVLWHVVLNACAAAGKLPEGRERQVHISAAVDRENKMMRIFVENLAPLESAMRLEKEAEFWDGLQNDKATMEVLWLDTLPNISPEDPLSLNIRLVDDLSLVEVTIHAPAIIS